MASLTHTADTDGFSDAPRAPFAALALGGGAFEGAVYEIGALRAFDEALADGDVRDFGIFAGVSAGGFLASCLANGVSTGRICRALVGREPGVPPCTARIFFRPAAGELLRRLASSPRWLALALWRVLARRGTRLPDVLNLLSRTLPVSVFDNEPIRGYVEKIFTGSGYTADFRRLRRRLVVVATDLESGAVIHFGRPGWRPPIPTAVQATTALPGLYPPVEIDGRFYVDGILRETLHAAAALEAGAGLVVCINPVVPVDARRAVEEHLLPQGEIVRSGLPSVLSQTIRGVVHSRMALDLKACERRYPDARILLLEPSHDDHRAFFTDFFGLTSRREVAERAYQATRRSLLQRRDELSPVLAEHGLELDLDVLQDESRDLWSGVGLPELVTRRLPNPGTATPAPAALRPARGRSLSARIPYRRTPPAELEMPERLSTPPRRSPRTTGI